jgi:ATP-dependent Clp protease ATP-binding subunit ClpX
MIPEFTGRLPVIATLDELDEQAMVDILVKPKNALTKQYQAPRDGRREADLRRRLHRGHRQEAIKKNTGARGLRAILETTMLEVMYEIPAKKDMAEVIITPETILEDRGPKLVRKVEQRTGT